jgi:hypothetical protein
MNDSRYRRLTACLDDARTDYVAAEPHEVRRLADELDTSDPRVFLLRMAARMVEQHLQGLNDILSALEAVRDVSA